MRLVQIYIILVINSLYSYASLIADNLYSKQVRERSQCLEVAIWVYFDVNKISYLCYHFPCLAKFTITTKKKKKKKKKLFKCFLLILYNTLSWFLNIFAIHFAIIIISVVPYSYLSNKQRKKIKLLKTHKLHKGDQHFRLWNVKNISCQEDNPYQKREYQLFHFCTFRNDIWSVKRVNSTQRH